jgi:hypothetical protein
VVPRSRGTQGFQLGPEERPHVDDPFCHGLDIGLPLGKQVGVVQDTVDNSDTVGGRIGVPGTHRHGIIELVQAVILSTFKMLLNQPLEKIQMI